MKTLLRRVAQLVRHYLFHVEKPNFYLVRHGFSATNAFKKLHGRMSDPATILDLLGHRQAKANGQFFVSLFRAMPVKKRPKKLRIIRSNYMRAIQTAQHIEEALREAFPEMVIEVRDVGRLRELEFGFVGFEGVSQLPHVRWLSDLLRYQGYKFYAKRYGGEAPSDVEIRARLAIAAMYRDQEKHGVHDFIVVNHGLTLRVLTMILGGYDVHWYEKEPNPDNLATRAFIGGKDQGYIFPNAKGQWDETWVDEGEDVSNLNPGGLYFSAEEMRAMPVLQEEFPNLLADLNGLFEAEPQLAATEALARITGPRAAELVKAA